MKNKELVKKMYDLQDEKDFKSVRELLSPDFKFISPFSSTPQSVDESMEFMEDMFDAFEGKQTIDLMIEEGEYVAVRATWTGKHVGEFEGIPATNKKVTMTFQEIFRIQNGKITEDYLEMNHSTIYEQIGVAPVHSH